MLLCSDSSHNGIIAIESPLSQALNLLECILFAKTDGKVSVSKISVSITDNIQNYNSTLKKNDEVTVTGKIQSSGNFPGGQAGVALVNNSGNIVAVVGTTNWNALSWEYAERALTIKFSPSDVKAGKYNLRFVTKMNGETNWKIVTAALPDVPKSIPFTVTE